MPEGAPHDPDAHRLGRRYVTLLVAGVSVVALTCVAFLLPAPYVTMRPGPAFDTFGEIGGRQMFTFGKGVKTYPVDGALDFTTVSVTRADTHVSLGSVVEAFLTSDVAVVPRDIVYPDDESAAASKAEGQAQLTSSKDSSLVVALRAAGYRVGERASVAAVAPTRATPPSRAWGSRWAPSTTSRSTSRTTSATRWVAPAPAPCSRSRSTTA